MPGVLRELLGEGGGAFKKRMAVIKRGLRIAAQRCAAGPAGPEYDTGSRRLVRILRMTK